MVAVTQRQENAREDVDNELCLVPAFPSGSGFFCPLFPVDCSGSIFLDGFLETLLRYRLDSIINSGAKGVASRLVLVLCHVNYAARYQG